ncbi:MAG: prepilin peptidase, partial [Pantoea sp. Pent]|nr:prepilin peptidase [Pantoea sp. Pent]
RNDTVSPASQGISDSINGFLCLSCKCLPCPRTGGHDVPGLYTLLWLGLLLKALHWLPGTLNDAVFGAVAGYSALWLMGELYQLINKRPGLGGGDVKLLAALGAWLGWALLPFVLLLACTGAILFVLLTRLGWQRELHHVLPFGPWLALAGISLFIHTII